MRLCEYKKPLMLHEVETPSIGSKDALVRIDACGVCHTDIHFAEGDMQVESFGGKRPITLGHEIAGKVVEIGSEVKGVKVSDLVLVDSYTAYSCGNCILCRTGYENLCMYNTMPGFAIDGGYAEYIAVPARSLIKINMRPEDAAPLSCGGVTAFRALRKAGVTPSDTVVIIGVGGLGLFAIQIAKAIGATVVAIDILPEKLKFAEKFGADYIVNGEKNLVNEVLNITHGAGADVVIDFVCSSITLENALRIIGKLGRLMTIGSNTGPLTVTPPLMIKHELTISAVQVGTHKDLMDLVELVKKGIIKPITTETFKLEEVNAAMELIKSGKIFGRCVVKP